MKTDYSVGFSNLTSEEARYQISPGDKLEVLLNKYSPTTELWTVSGNYITHGKYHLGFLFESNSLAPRRKGFIMCRIPNSCGCGYTTSSTTSYPYLSHE